MTTLTSPQTAADTTTWTIDPSHSNVEFSVKHLMVSTVKGRFKNVSGTLNIDEANPSRSEITAAVEVASVETGAQQRDEHLRSDDFFNAAQYPEITFRGTNIERQRDQGSGDHGSGEAWKLTGDLTIRDVTKPVVLDVEFEGRAPDPWGGERAGFTASTKINRKDFGVNWNGAIEAGGVVVGETVKIAINLEIVKQS